MKKITYIFVLLLCFVAVTIEKINAQCIPPSTFNQGNGTCSDIQLYWSSSSGATSYYLDISTDVDFINKLPNYNNRNVGNTNTYLASGLNSNSTYYARIRACNSSDPRANSSTLTCFTTAVPQPPTANGGSGAASNKITANWSFVGGVDGYYLELLTKNGTNYNPVPGYEKFNAGNTTSITLTGLTPSTTYYYRVKTYSGTCESGSSNMISYATLSYEAPPSAPTGFSQVYGTCNEIILYWNEASNATGYYLDVSTNNSFDSFVEGYNNKNIGFTTSFTVNSNLTSGTTYYARIRAFNASNPGDYSSTITCNTTSFPAPIAIGGSGATTNQITVNWNSQGNVSGYYLDLSTNSSFTEIVQGYYNYPVGNETSKTITGLKSGTKYYYRVKSYSGACVSNYSNTIDYATLLNAPSAPSEISQDYGNCHLMSFHWPAVPDAASYYLDVSTEESFSSFVDGYANLYIGNEPNYTVDKNLSPNTTYYIRLRASNASGTSSSSDPFRCTTSNTMANPIISGGIASTNQITLNWSGGNGYGYLLDVSLNNSFVSFVQDYYNYDVGKETSRTISNLIPGTSYYFRLRSYLTGCESESTVKSYATVPLSSVNNENYIISRTILKDNVKDISSVSSLTTQDMQQSIVYYDGLGRPMQQVSWRSSPSMMDIIQPIAYDEVGRESIKYLPYVDLDREGLYRADALNETYSLSDHYKFYTNGYNNAPDVINEISENGITYNQPLNKEVNIIAPSSIILKPGFSSNGHNMTIKSDPTASISSDAIEDKIKPFSVSVFEASPLNRVLEQGASGQDWQPSDNSGSSDAHTTKLEYATNIKADVLLLSVDDAGKLVNTTGENVGGKYFYYANELIKTIVKNENWNSESGKKFITEEFKNKSGQVVLKRTYTDDETPVETYYVYDDLDLLRYVISPEAVNKLTFPADKSNTIIQQLCYYYEYDHRQRMIEKQIPGASAVYLVYDKRDRLVLTQDGKMRAENPNKWLFTKYDAFNRPVLTGEYTHTSALSQAAMQTEVNNFYTGDKQYFEKAGTQVHGYTNQSFPNVTDENAYLTVMYYDNYNTVNTWGSDYAYSFGNTGVKGQVTGTKTKVLGTDIWLKTAIYYDNKYRVIQTRRDLYDGSNSGKEIVSTAYDFVGKVLQVHQEQTFNGNKTAIDKNMVYDHVGRLLKTEQQIVGDANSKVTLASHTYNELGQLQTKQIGENAQTVDYKYNLRGWLTHINDPAAPGSDLFAMKLLYNNNDAISGLTAEPQFNGNISGMIVNRKDNAENSSTTYGYGFTYDALNRLTESDYGEGTGFTTNADKYNEFGIKYDANGNILNLKRNSGSLIDNLSYTYMNEGNSNQLESVSDASVNTNGFKDVTGTDYSYDANGNLTKENNKGIASISYNSLNLPNVLSKDGNNNIKYVYDASGAKLCKETTVAGTTTKRWYCGAMEYGDNMALSMIHTDEGMIDVTTSGTNQTFNYAYYLKDHLGNTRAVFNKDGSLLQRTDYYPFGMTANSYSSSTDNKYLYNGKELQQDLALDWYDYGARFYDPMIGRWHSVDPLAELYTEYSLYNYCLNNPINSYDNLGLDVVDAGDRYIITGDDIYTYFGYLQTIANTSNDNSQKAMKDNLMEGLSVASKKYDGEGGPMDVTMYELKVFGDNVKVGDALASEADILDYFGSDFDVTITQERTNEQINKEIKNFFWSWFGLEDEDAVTTAPPLLKPKINPNSINQNNSIKSSTKNERKINQKRLEKWLNEEKKLRDLLKNAKTKVEKKEIQRKIDHARLQQQKSEAHARDGQGY